MPLDMIVIGDTEYVGVFFGDASCVHVSTTDIDTVRGAWTD